MDVLTNKYTHYTHLTYRKDGKNIDYLNAIFLSRWGSIPSGESFWGWGSVLEAER